MALACGLVACTSLPAPLAGQGSGKASRIFFAWGYNVSAFTKSDVRLRGVEHDFTVFDLQANDRPSKPSLRYLNPGQFTAPQYNIELGYFVTDQFSVTIAVDHIKYIMDGTQPTRFTGSFGRDPTGNPIEYEDALIHDVIDDFHLEHSDGLNYISLEGNYNYSAWQSQDRRFAFDAIVGGGVGGVMPKTRIVFDGQEVDNEFHWSGWAVSATLGARFWFFNHFYAQPKVKLGYVDVIDALTTGNDADRASQKLGFSELNVLLGFSVPLGGNDEAADERN